jgi:AraC-like DNA-binding protein
MQPIIARSATANRSPNGPAINVSNRTLLEAMVKSRLYQDYASAFSHLTGLPLALQPAETWQLPHHGKRHENALCALMSQKSSSCAACLQTQARLCRPDATGPQTAVCALGLSDSAVPIRLNDRLIGFLQIGQVFRKAPTAARFEKAARQAEKWGIKTDRAILKQAYFSGRVVTPMEHSSALGLLNVFAQQLAALSNQLLIQQENAEPPIITQARRFIQDHQTEDICLGQVAKAVHSSRFYFCKLFKRIVGNSFTDYVSRLRIEKSKNLLLNPNQHIAEIAYGIGFQSLTHFNRVFKRIQGLSPTEYRAQLVVT